MDQGNYSPTSSQMKGDFSSEWLMQNLHTKYEISELLIKMCKCSILTAIASGYAGRDPQGGFCDRRVYAFVLKSL